MTELDVNYVYLIAHGQNGTFCGPVKVGFSKYPDKRLSSLQTGNPHPIIGFIADDVSDPALIASLCEFSGVWDAVTLWDEMRGDAHV